MIRFQCTCGKQLKVEDTLAGRAARCPHCGTQVQVPQAEPEPLSGPVALQAAMRGSQGDAASEEVPTVEMVGGPSGARRPPSPPPRPSPQTAQAAQAIKGLDALAKAAGPAPTPPARPPRRAAKPKGRGRKTPNIPDRAAIPNGRLPPVAGNIRKAAIIGAVAAVVLIIMAVIAASFIGRGDVEPGEKPSAETPSAETPSAETAAEQPERRRFKLRQPGELFGDVNHADEENDEAEKGKNQQH